MLSSHVLQVFYIADERHPNWSCVVRTKPQNVYDIGEGKGNDDSFANYHESEPLNLNITHHSKDVMECCQNDLPPNNMYMHFSKILC